MSDEADQDEGPGWMPAILAGTLLLGIFGFICCGVSTWVLYQQRTELAIRTLRGSYIAEIEQSLLEPEEKSAVLAQIDELAKEMERGKYEDWQSAGVMQRLQRLPVLQWGELSAIEAFINKSDAEDKEDSLDQISRLRRAVEIGEAISLDVEEVLKPVLIVDEQSPNGRRMNSTLADDDVREVVLRAKLVADRGEVPEKRYDVQIDSIVRREIETGLREGGF